MKKQILTLLVSVSFTLSIIPAPQSKTRSLGSMFTSFVTFPDEVYLDAQIIPDASGLIKLDENRIHELHAKIKYNFIRRNQLSYGSSALAAAVFAIGLYQLGFFNLVLPAPKITAANPQDIESRLAFLEKAVKSLSDKANLQPQVSRMEWLLNGTKSITSFFTLAIASAKLMQIKNYIEAKPTIAYFLGKQNLMERVEVLRKTVAAAIQPMDDDIHSLDYHRRAVTPMLQAIAVNLEKFVAFTEYYFTSQDQEMVHNQEMEDQSRRLFNISNTFLKKMHEQLQKPVFDPDIVAIVEEFKGELALSIKRCTFFEKEFVQED
jgi:hypothetical protein